MNALANLWSRWKSATLRKRILMGCGSFVLLCVFCSVCIAVLPSSGKATVTPVFDARLIVSATPNPSNTPQMLSATPTARLTATATNTPRPTSPPNPIETPPLATSTPVVQPKPTVATSLIVNTSAIIGSPVADVEKVYGKPLEVMPAGIGEIEEIPDGGETRTYEFAKYQMYVNFDKKGIAQGLQVIEGLKDENYGLDDWSQILRRMGITVTRAPDVSAPAARRWNNYQGYAIFVAASKIGGTVWTVRVYKIPR